MCEVYCPVDALYVAPNAEAPTAVEEAALGGLLGSYRNAIGWTKGGRARRASDLSFKLLTPL